MGMPGPGGGGDFLEHLLGDLLGLMGSSAAGGASQIELARTLAQSVATGGQPEPNVEPVARMELEQIARVAELHIAELTGFPVTPDGTPVEILAVGPGAWAWHTLEDWRFLLEAMSPDPDAGRRTPPLSSKEDAPQPEPKPEPGLGLVDLGPEARSLDETGPQGAADLVARFMSTMGPMLVAMQLGSAVGHLARTALGPYEVPIPRQGTRLLMVPQNLDRFATDWSLPLDQVRLWICLRELTTHSVLPRAQVASRFRDLLAGVVAAFAADSAGIMDRLGTLDPTDPEALQGLMADPEALFGTTEPSPAQLRAREELAAATAALLGYVEHVLDAAASRLLGGRTALTEAWRRRQHERETTERAAELLFGLDLGPAQVDRGVAFVSGVLARAGEDGLSMLWSAGSALPTPSEIEAPGLWLERVRMTEEKAEEESEGT